MTYCFDIGGSFIRYGLSDEAGMVSEAGRVPTPGTDFDAFVQALKDAIAAMLGHGTGDVSISIAGIVDPQSGLTVIANVPCCDRRPLAEDLGNALGRTVRITNDADCFALAEARLGAGRGHSNVFAIILGSGVGGGIVLNGQLVTGAGGVTGEWGHGPIVDPTAGGLVDGIEPFQCGCGHVGCLDTVGGARGMERLHEAIHAISLDSNAILAAWRSGEAAAEKTVAVFVEHLARSLCVAVNTLGASIVPVGGGLASADDLIAALDKRVRELVLATYAEALVVPGKRRADGGLVGAAAVAMSSKARAA